MNIQKYFLQFQRTYVYLLVVDHDHTLISLSLFLNHYKLYYDYSHFLNNEKALLYTGELFHYTIFDVNNVL